MFGIVGAIFGAKSTGTEMAVQGHGGRWKLEAEVSSMVGFFGSFYTQLEQMCQQMLNYGGASAANLAFLDQHLSSMGETLAPDEETQAKIRGGTVTLSALLIERCKLAAACLSEIYRADTFTTMVKSHPSISDEVEYDLTPAFSNGLALAQGLLSAPALPAICGSLANFFGTDHDALSAPTMDAIVLDLEAIQRRLVLPSFVVSDHHRHHIQQLANPPARTLLDGTPDAQVPGFFPEPMELCSPSPQSKAMAFTQLTATIAVATANKNKKKPKKSRLEKLTEAIDIDARIKAQYIRQWVPKEPTKPDAKAMSKLYSILKGHGNTRSRKPWWSFSPPPYRETRFTQDTLTPPRKRGILLRRGKLEEDTFEDPRKPSGCGRSEKAAVYRYGTPPRPRQHREQMRQLVQTPVASTNVVSPTTEASHTQPDISATPQEVATIMGTPVTERRQLSLQSPSTVADKLHAAATASQQLRIRSSSDRRRLFSPYERPIRRSPSSSPFAHLIAPQTDISHQPQDLPPINMTSPTPEQVTSYASSIGDQPEVPSERNPNAPAEPQAPTLFQPSEQATASVSSIENHNLEPSQRAPTEQDMSLEPPIEEPPSASVQKEHVSPFNSTITQEQLQALTESTTTKPMGLLTLSSITGQRSVPSNMASPPSEDASAPDSTLVKEQPHAPSGSLFTSWQQHQAATPSTTEQITALNPSYLQEQLQAPANIASSTTERVTAPASSFEEQSQTPSRSFFSSFTSWWQPRAPTPDTSASDHSIARDFSSQEHYSSSSDATRSHGPSLIEQPEGMLTDGTPVRLAISQEATASQTTHREMDDDEPSPSQQLIDEMAAVSAQESSNADPRDETATLFTGLNIHQRPSSRFLDLLRNRSPPPVTPQRRRRESHHAPETSPRSPTKSEARRQEEKRAATYATIMQIMTQPSDKPLAISTAQKASILKEKQEEEARIAEELRKAEEEARRAAEERARLEREERLARSGGLRLPEKTFVADLTEDWRTRALNTLNAAPTTTLSVTGEGVDLRRHDFAKLVQATEWLNDEVINGTLNFLDSAINLAAGVKDVKRSTRKCLSMNSFFFKRLRDRGVTGTERTLRRCGVERRNLLDVETILLPICEGSHWTLCVIRPVARTVAHMDSLNPRGSANVTQLALSWLEDFLGEKFDANEWKVVSHGAPEQVNGWDCGVHTITNAMCVSLGLSPADCYEAHHMPLQRLRIACVLLNQGFKDQFDLAGF